MSEEPVPSRWQAVLEQMFEELRSGSPRAEAYWAQQLAFGPVFFSARPSRGPKGRHSA